MYPLQAFSAEHRRRSATQYCTDHKSPVSQRGLRTGGFCRRYEAPTDPVLVENLSLLSHTYLPKICLAGALGPSFVVSTVWRKSRWMVHIILWFDLYYVCIPCIGYPFFALRTTDVLVESPLRVLGKRNRRSPRPLEHRQAWRSFGKYSSVVQPKSGETAVQETPAGTNLRTVQVSGERILTKSPHSFASSSSKRYVRRSTTLNRNLWATHLWC